MLVCNNTDCDTKHEGKPGDTCPTCGGDGRLVRGDSIAETNRRNFERFGHI